MSELLQCDIAIIGGGACGLSVAAVAAQLGLSVVLAEANKMGGDCLNYGCIPSKSLIAAARSARGFVSSAPFGIEPKTPNVDFKRVMEHVANVINLIKNSDNGIDVFVELQEKQHTIHGSHLLVATGRSPNITGLALEKAGIVYTLQGITVSPRLRTTNKRVYAIGDAAEGYQFTHITNYHAGIVIQNIIFKIPSKVDYRSIPWVTYTTPELAHSGLTAGEALKTYKDARVISLPFGDNDRARTEHMTIGNIKVIVTKKGKVLGCSILGEHAGELIIPWIMLIKEGKSLRHLTDLIIPYPTLSEVSKRIASEFYAPKLFSDTVRRVVRFLKYLG